MLDAWLCLFSVMAVGGKRVGVVSVNFFATE
jgi:hypothetical protein